MTQIHHRNTQKLHIRSILCFVVLFGVLIFVVSPISTVQAAKQEDSSGSSLAWPSDPRELETFLDDVLGSQLQENHIPGAMVSVVKDGQLVLAKGYGTCNLQTGRPVNADTSLFQIGSVGKLITATAVMQLAEQGKVDLHADINTYLKSFHISTTYPEPITLASLLTHTAGFEDHITGSDATSIGDIEPLGQWLAKHLPAQVRPPGQLTAYSNYGFALAGYIVEQVSGMPFEQYLDQNIFQPLDMRSSTFRQPLPENLSAGMCTSYTFTGNGYRAHPFELLQDVPAGSFTATATDMAHFMIAMLQKGSYESQRILQADTVETMQSRQFGNDPRVAGETYGFEELYLNSQRLIVHSGLTSSFSSYLTLLPEQQVGLFVSYNSDGGLSAQNALIQAFIDRYFPVSQPVLPDPQVGSTERMKQISGEYWPTRRGYTTYEKIFGLFGGIHVADADDGTLAISSVMPSLGSAPWMFSEVTPGVFRRVDGRQKFVFKLDANGTYLMIDNDPAEAYVKTPWYDSSGFHLAIVSACMLLFLSGLVLWLVGITRRSVRRNNLSILANGLAGLACGLNVLFMIGFILFFPRMGAYPVIFRGAPPLLVFLFITAILSAMLTVCILICAFFAWLRRFWSTGRRIHYTLVAFATVIFILELLHWNMLGFHV